MPCITQWEYKNTIEGAFEIHVITQTTILDDRNRLAKTELITTFVNELPSTHVKLVDLLEITVLSNDTSIAHLQKFSDIPGTFPENNFGIVYTNPQNENDVTLKPITEKRYFQLVNTESPCRRALIDPFILQLALSTHPRERYANIAALLDKPGQSERNEIAPAAIISMINGDKF